MIWLILYTMKEVSCCFSSNGAKQSDHGSKAAIGQGVFAKSLLFRSGRKSIFIACQVDILFNFQMIQEKLQKHSSNTFPMRDEFFIVCPGLL
jgi:hypothetical protein